MLSYALPLFPLAISLRDQANRALSYMAEKFAFQSLLGPTVREHRFYVPEGFGFSALLEAQALLTSLTLQSKAVMNRVEVKLTPSHLSLLETSAGAVADASSWLD